MIEIGSATSVTIARPGLAQSVLSWDRKVAPANAPTAPGTPSFQTRLQSTLPSRQWDTPEAMLVPISAR